MPKPIAEGARVMFGKHRARKLGAKGAVVCQRVEDNAFHLGSWKRAPKIDIVASAIIVGTKWKFFRSEIPP